MSLDSDSGRSSNGQRFVTLPKVHPLHPHSQDLGPVAYNQHAARQPSQTKQVRRFRSKASFSDDGLGLFEDAVASHPHLTSAASAAAVMAMAAPSVSTKIFPISEQLHLFAVLLRMVNSIPNMLLSCLQILQFIPQIVWF